jgi:hypothetical protein
MERWFHNAVLAVAIAAPSLIAPEASQAQNQVRGRVKDENSRPVSFVQVQLVPGDRRVIADQNGEFVIAGLRTGDYALKLRRIGFTPAEIKVHVPSDEGWIPITMTSLPRVLDSIRIRERASILRYTGIVVDDLDQPVVGAEVIGAGAADRGVRTDSSGHFRLDKMQKGTLVLRVRKFGYAPYFGSLTFRTEREDTIRMKRHPTDLPEAYIRAESGFGRDSFAYVELDSRMRWKLSTGGVASREDLDPWIEMDLCQALMRTAVGGKMQLRESGCSLLRCVIIDGLQPIMRPLNSFTAAEVETFEYHEKDLSGTLASRYQGACTRGMAAARGAGGIVIWLRRQPS